MSNPPEPPMHHYQIKNLILLPLRAIYFYSLWYETPCKFVVRQDKSFALSFAGPYEGLKIWWHQFGGHNLPLPPPIEIELSNLKKSGDNPQGQHPWFVIQRVKNQQGAWYISHPDMTMRRIMGPDMEICMDNSWSCKHFLLSHFLSTVCWGRYK